MTENEKKVREWISLYGRHGTQTGPLGMAFDALLAEHRAEVSAARDAALEAAAAALRKKQDPEVWSEWDYAEEIVSSLKSQPARRFLDAEEVERVLRRNWENHTGDAGDAVLNVSRELGLDLGTTPASEEQLETPRCDKCTGTELKP